MVIINFGFRYHLASLLAVFFSLMLGILIGGALFQDSALVEEQGRLIADMEARFSASQDNLNRLKTRLSENELAWLELRDAVLPGLLQAKTVVIGDGGAKQQEMDALEDLLRLAGAASRRVKIDDLAQLEEVGNKYFIFWPGDGYSATELGLLKEKGAGIALVWAAAEQPLLESFPPCLRIDGIDSVQGQIALVLGLAAGAEGHYGLQAAAQALFP